ncbi:hypothetical protein RRG08_038467 [Elysia crispata]|uniref:Uncharacterized protein n=1 Tax=Elysia crispata TaxID=231223 RepID=A0AAE1DNM4_9GAST|nr:hypothetical protein RRG08_038467 [Elysia crispata]
MLKMLLQYGADVNVQVEEHSSSCGCSAGACVNTVTQSGDTPLSAAIGYKQLVELGYLSRLRNYRSRRVQVGYNTIVLKLLRFLSGSYLSYKDRHSLHTAVAGARRCASSAVRAPQDRQVFPVNSFAHYDIVRLCWDLNIRCALAEGGNGNSQRHNYHWASSFEVEESTAQARQLQLLDSRWPAHLLAAHLSLITISSALSQHLTKHIRYTHGNKQMDM